MTANPSTDELETLTARANESSLHRATPTQAHLEPPSHSAAVRLCAARWRRANCCEQWPHAATYGLSYGKRDSVRMKLWRVFRRLLPAQSHRYPPTVLPVLALVREADVCGCRDTRSPLNWPVTANSKAHQVKRERTRKQKGMWLVASAIGTTPQLRDNIG